MTDFDPTIIPHNGGPCPTWIAPGDTVRRYSPSHILSPRRDILANSVEWNACTGFHLPADHWALPAIKAGMTPWRGGDIAPVDWDGGPVMRRGGAFHRPEPYIAPYHYNERWHHMVNSSAFDIIGYTPKDIHATIYAKALERSPNKMRNHGFDIGAETWQTLRDISTTWRSRVNMTSITNSESVQSTSPNTDKATRLLRALADRCGVTIEPATDLPTIIDQIDNITTGMIPRATVREWMMYRDDITVTLFAEFDEQTFDAKPDPVEQMARKLAKIMIVVPWDKMSEESRDNFRKGARAALAKDA